jgi:hypothetical protein
MNGTNDISKLKQKPFLTLQGKNLKMFQSILETAC